MASYTDADLEQIFEAGYQRGFSVGFGAAKREHQLTGSVDKGIRLDYVPNRAFRDTGVLRREARRKAKRKPSAWNKFVAANSKKKKYIYQSGAKRGKLNLKKMGVDYRKKKR